MGVERWYKHMLVGAKHVLCPDRAFRHKKGVPYMACRRLLLLALLLLLSNVFQVCGATMSAPHIDPVDLKNILLVRDVKPGMKGYGKTVFHGATIERFDVVVLGVMKKVNFGTDLILVKMSGGPISKRGANLIEGMSGSPIYINNKLIGALAFGEAFGKEPIAMVTPIEYMLDAWDPKLPDKPSSFSRVSTSPLTEPIALGGRTYTRLSIDYSGDAPMEPGTLLFRPLATSLMVSGMSPRIMAWLQESFRPLNVRIVAGPGAAPDKTDVVGDIKPGSAIGVSLVRGDLDITGIGTVTYRRGNKILAFGHPMLASAFMNGVGPLDATMTSAYVYEIFPSVLVSSKIAAPVKAVGRIFQDRPWAVAGEVGKPAAMVPVTVHVDDRSSGRKKNYNIQVINHPMLTPNLVVAAAGEAIFEVRGSPGDAMADVKFAVTADEVGTIVRENVYFDPIAIDIEATGELAQLMNMLQFNQFYPVSVKKVDVWVVITPKHQTAKLERIFIKEGKYKPGDTVEVSAVLKPYKGERVTKTLSLTLPKNIPNGRLMLQVKGGGMAGEVPVVMPSEGVSPMTAPEVMSRPPQPSVENLQQLIKKFLEREKNNELVAKIQLGRLSPVIAGEKLQGLPPSIAEAMKSSKATPIGTEREEIKVSVPTEWVISGMQTLSITVQKEDKTEKKAPSTAVPTAPSSATPDETTEQESRDRPESQPPEEMFGLQASSLTTGYALAAASNTPATPEKKIGSEPDTKDASDSSGEKLGAPEVTSSGSYQEKPIGRAPSVWKQTTRTEFLAGTMKNVTATTGDLLMLGPSLKPLFDSSETYVWCLLPDGKGGVYAGTGNHGIVYKVDATGTSSVVCDLEELEIHSLTMDRAGNIYAGTSPNGLVVKIDTQGRTSTLFDAEEKYIVALACDDQDNLYAATGDKCKVYKISPSGDVKVILESSEAHALSLALDSAGNVYVGTGLDGIIYKIKLTGEVATAYDAADDSVTSLAVSSEGVLYAGTSPKGIIYKLAPDTTPKVLYDKAGAGIVGMGVDGSGNLYAATSSNVFRILPDESVCTVGNDRDLQWLSLALSQNTLYLGTANIGSVYVADIDGATEGTFESPVHDCGQVSKWGVIEWTADVPDGSSLTFQTRTGPVAQPDSTWSEWSAPYLSPGARIISPPARYIQYLAVMKANDSSRSPKIKDVSIVFLPKNQAPKVTLSTPKGGEKWSKKKTIKWTGTDPDKDTLTYEVYCSKDGGATWERLSDQVKSAGEPKKEEVPDKEESSPKEKPNSTNSEAIKLDASNADDIVAQITAELEKHPEIPQDVKDKLLESAPEIAADSMAKVSSSSSAVEKDRDTSSKESGAPTKETSYTWDTSKYPDGTYLVKVVATDRLSNPIDPLSAEAISEPIVVTNKPPLVFAFKKTITVQTDKSVRFEGFAWHDLVAIAGVQFKVDAGDWMAAASSDGIFDTSFENFIVETQPLSKGKHTVEVKAIDAAGNAATIKVDATVE